MRQDRPISIISLSYLLLPERWLWAQRSLLALWNKLVRNELKGGDRKGGDTPIKIKIKGHTSWNRPTEEACYSRANPWGKPFSWYGVSEERRPSMMTIDYLPHISYTLICPQPLIRPTFDLIALPPSSASRSYHHTRIVGSSNAVYDQANHAPTCAYRFLSFPIPLLSLTYYRDIFIKLLFETTVFQWRFESASHHHLRYAFASISIRRWCW